MTSSISTLRQPIVPPVRSSFSPKIGFLRSLCLRNATSAIRCSISRRPEYIPNHIPDPKYVRIFDTTLRDCKQSPGAIMRMTTKKKLDIAGKLALLGVDIIEPGFPASSDADFEAIKLIAHEVGAADSDHVPVICGLARCNKRDIERAWEAVKYAKKPRIHTIFDTSEIYMNYKLKITEQEIGKVIDKARSMVAYARSLGCDDAQFSPEYAGRLDREFLYQILGEVIRAGATTLNIPDTLVPDYEFGQLIADIKANTPGIENVIISTHCQDDLGLSTANTLERFIVPCECGYGAKIFLRAGEKAQNPGRFYYRCPMKNGTCSFVWADELLSHKHSRLHHVIVPMPQFMPGSERADIHRRVSGFHSPSGGGLSEQASSSDHVVSGTQMPFSAPSPTPINLICCCYGLFCTIFCIVLVFVTVLLSMK